MLIEPNSIIKILGNVPLDNKCKNTIHFDSKSAQQLYFSGKSKYTRSAYHYMKEQKKIRVDIKADNLFDCNYLMYQNTSFGLKWFYAFITKVEYINNETSEISFEIDVMQTWLAGFDYEIKPSFVEREHVSDDTIFTHLLDESLDYGEYIYKEYQKSNLFNNLSYVLGIADLSPVLPDNVTANPRLYDRLFSGLVYWAFDVNDIESMITFIKTYYSAEKASALEYIFTIPTAFLPDGLGGQLMSGEVSRTLDWNYQTTFTDIDGYVPKNKKLFNYPYNVLSISNNTGNTSVYRFEDFLHPENIHFDVQSNIAPNPTVMCIPRNFKKHIDFNSNVPEYGIALNGFPLCSWTSDTYRAWLAQNGLGVIGGTVGGIGASILGISTGNVIALGGGIASIYSQMSQVYKASVQPDQARGNTLNGSFNIAHSMQDFYLQHLTIKSEYAKRIDDFFSMFGYKVNAVKVPNISTRNHWNYVKTIDVCLVGSVPADDMEKIQNIFNAGVTYWKNGDEVGDYTLDNSI